MSSHSDPRIQKMLECYVQSYLKRRIPSAFTTMKCDQNSMMT